MQLTIMALNLVLFKFASYFYEETKTYLIGYELTASRLDRKL